MTLDEAGALAAIADRRAAGVAFDGVELSRRIDELGDMSLSRKSRHVAFDELYGAFTPSPFRLVPFPDDSRIATTSHRIRVRAVIVDDDQGQVVGEIDRDLILDSGSVNHELLRLQDEYRGAGLSLVLLRQSFPRYRDLGLSAVVVHAALQTGRWQWARLGFEFARHEDRVLVMSWAQMALAGLGLPLVEFEAPARRLAQLGTGEPSERVSLEDVRAAMEKELASWKEDPARCSTADALIAQWDQRVLGETGGKLRMLDLARLQMIATANSLRVDELLPVGKAVMLTGPDWFGVFDLQDEAAQDAFDREFSRRFANI
jgi:hypothetical protein